MEVGKWYNVLVDSVNFGEPPREAIGNCIYYNINEPYAKYVMYFPTVSPTYSVVTEMGTGAEGNVFILSEVKPKRKLVGWVNINKFEYGDTSGSVWFSEIYETKQFADKLAGSLRVGCIDLSKYNIEFEEGEGLE